MAAYGDSSYSGVRRVEAVTFSTDGSKMLAAGGAGLFIWDVATGQEIKRLGEHAGWIKAAAFSPDSSKVVSGGLDKIATLWDITTGQEIRRFTGHSRYITAVAFSPDGKKVLTGSGQAMSQDVDKTLRLWDVETGKEVNNFGGYASDITAIAFSFDGSRILTGSADFTARLWDSATGRQGASINVGLNAPAAVAFTSNDDQVLIAAYRAGLWSATTGKEIRSFEGYAKDVTSVAFSADGAKILTGGYDDTARLWDVATGQLSRSFKGHSDWIRSVAFSRDGRKILTAGNDGKAILWDAESGAEIKRFQGHSNWLTSAVISPDGLRVLAASADGTAPLWDATTGQEINRFKFGSRFVFSVAFSSDGSKVLAAGDENLTILYDATTGKEIRRFVTVSERYSPQYQPALFSVAFSPDDKFALIGGQDGIARLWDIATGNEVRRYQKHTGQIFAVAFSPDGKFVLTGSSDDTAILWDAASAAPIRQFIGHTSGLKSVSFSPDGSKVLTGSEDSTTRLWDAADGKELCQLLSFQDGTYVVVAQDGRFDTNNLEESKGLHWVMPDDPFHPLPIEIFMRQYYEPRLLPRLLAGEEFKLLPPLTSLNREQPAISIARIEPSRDAPDEVNVTVEVEKAKRTGVYDLRLFRERQLVGYAPQTAIPARGTQPLESDQPQSAELNAWRQDNEIKLDASGRATITFPHIQLPRTADLKQIEFSAYAFNSDKVKSQTDRKTFEIPSSLTPTKGRAYIIAVGVNAYENSDFDLEFAAADALRMSQVMSEKLAATGQYEKVVPVTLISDYEVRGGQKVLTQRDATKANFKAVLELLSGRQKEADTNLSTNVSNVKDLRPATPNDLVLIMYSSHGYRDNRTGNFYFIPYDTGEGRGKVFTSTVRQHSISSEELSLWLRDVDAGEMVMVVDACHSTAAVAGRDFKPGPMGSRGLGQLSYDKGMRILTATQSDNVALENGALKQGLLTYALIRDGIEARQADFKPKDNEITISELLQFGVERVPKLYEEVNVNKVQRFSGETAEPAKVVLGGNKQLEEEDGTSNGSDGNLSLTLKVQQPSLFDFARKRSDVVLVRR